MYESYAFILLVDSMSSHKKFLDFDESSICMTNVTRAIVR